MFLLLIFLVYTSGRVEARTSIVEGFNAEQVCLEALPLTIKLYREGKFHDGPKKSDLQAVKGRCEEVQNELARN